MSTFYLKFTKPGPPGTEVNGSSQAVHHPRWIELESFSYGYSRSIGSATSIGHSDGSSTINEMLFVTADGTAFSGIFQACLNGTSYESVTMEATKNDKTLMRVVMTGGVMISSCQTGGDGVDRNPRMSFVLNFKAAAFTYLAAASATPAPYAGAPTPPSAKTK